MIAFKIILLLTILNLGATVVNAQPDDDLSDLGSVLADVASSIRCAISRAGPFWGTMFTEIGPYVGNFLKGMFGNVPELLNQLEGIADNLKEGDAIGAARGIANLPLYLIAGGGTIPATFENGKILLQQILVAWPKASKVSGAKKCG